MKKKGFTLIELLAVIVILAIIGLIAMPLVLKYIEKSRQESARLSAIAYKEEVERYLVFSKLDKTRVQLEAGVTYQLSQTTYEVASTTDVDKIIINNLVDIKGDKPTSGYLVLKDANTIEKIEMVISAYDVICNSVDCSVKSDNTIIEEEKYGVSLIEPDVNDTHLGIVYLDPTNLKNKCDAAIYLNNLNNYETSNLLNNGTKSPTGLKEGCMKFYIYSEDDSNYNLILDHNTTGIVSWNITGSNTEMVDAQKALDEDTKNWKLPVRLITADEVAAITKNNKFNGSTTTSTGYFWLESNTTSQPSSFSGKYAWLYDYTYQCTNYGCKIDDDNKYLYDNTTNTDYMYGYWTSTPVSGSTISVWRVGRECALYANNANESNYRRGIRPVVTISKAIISK